MHTIKTTLLVLLGCCCLAPAVSAQDYTATIREAARAVRTVLDQEVIPSTETARSVSAIYCNTMGRLMDNQQFREELRAIMAQGNDVEYEYQTFRDDLALYIGYFLRLEQVAFEQMDIDRGTAEGIIRYAAAVHNRLSEDLISYDQAIFQLEAFRDNACNFSARMADYQVNQDRWNTIKRNTAKISGVILTSVNTYAGTIGVIGVGVAVTSTAVGNMFPLLFPN